MIEGEYPKMEQNQSGRIHSKARIQTSLRNVVCWVAQVRAYPEAGAKTSRQRTVYWGVTRRLPRRGRCYWIHWEPSPRRCNWEDTMKLAGAHHGPHLQEVSWGVCVGGWRGYGSFLGTSCECAAELTAGEFHGASWLPASAVGAGNIKAHQNQREKSFHL